MGINNNIQMENIKLFHIQNKIWKTNIYIINSFIYILNLCNLSYNLYFY